MKDNLCAAIDTPVQTNRFLHYIEPVGVWSINPYRQCQHRCLYCISNSQGDSIPWFPAGAVVPALRSRLPQVPPDSELFVGALVDAYPSIERGLGITRLILRELVNQERPFCITTKSDLVTRDIDLLSEHPGHCDISISLCTLDDDALWLLEPGAPSSSERLAAIQMMRAAGIEVLIDAAPWIPGISNARELIVQRPGDVPIQFAPLDLHPFGGQITLLGRKYIQDEIEAEYYKERDSIGMIDGVVWKDPLPA